MEWECDCGMWLCSLDRPDVIAFHAGDSDEHNGMIVARRDSDRAAHRWFRNHSPAGEFSSEG